MVKLGKWKNCKKKFARYGLSEREQEIACARYLIGDDEWEVKKSEMKMTGFEIEKKKKPKTGFEQEEPEKPKTPEEIKLGRKKIKTLQSLWKSRTPAGGKGAGIRELGKARPVKTIPLTAQMPLWQPWRSLKSQHRLQTKMEKLQTKEQQYLTQEQLEKRAAYAVSIKKKDSGELEIILPALILDQLKMPTFKVGGGAKPKIVTNKEGEKGFWMRKGEKAFFVSIEKGKGKSKQEPTKAPKGSAYSSYMKRYKTKQEPARKAQSMGKSIETIKGIERFGKLRKALENIEQKVAETKGSNITLEEQYIDLPESPGVSGEEQYPMSYKRRRKHESEYTPGPGIGSRLDIWMKAQSHIYPPTDETPDPQGPGKSDYDWKEEATKSLQPLESYPQDVISQIILSAYTKQGRMSKIRLKKEGREDEIITYASNLVYEESAAKVLTSTKEILDIMDKVQNHYIRDILEQNLRRNAIGGDAAASEMVNKMDEQRRVYEEGPDEGKFISKSRAAIKLYKGWAYQDPQKGKEKIAKSKAKVDKERAILNKAGKEPEQVLAPKPPSEDVFGRFSKKQGTEGLKEIYPEGKITKKPKTDSISRLLINYLKMNKNE